MFHQTPDKVSPQNDFCVLLISTLCSSFGCFLQAVHDLSVGVAKEDQTFVHNAKCWIKCDPPQDFQYNGDDTGTLF